MHCGEYWLHAWVLSVNRFFFGRYYFSRFSWFEFHSRKIHDRENFNVDYFYRFRPFFVYFGCFSGICSLLLSLLFAHSRKIHARENFGWPFANNNSARDISGLQYLLYTFMLLSFKRIQENKITYTNIKTVMLKIY